MLCVLSLLRSFVRIGYHRFIGCSVLLLSPGVIEKRKKRKWDLIVTRRLTHYDYTLPSN